MTPAASPEAARPARTLHFLLRYNDDRHGVDTYAEHREMQRRHRSVWFGKFGMGISPRIWAKAMEQLEHGIPTFIYLGTRGRILYRARIIDLVGGRTFATYPPKEPSLVPRYYRDQRCGVWFKIKNLARANPAELERLALYNEPTAKPRSGALRPFMYVTIR